MLTLFHAPRSRSSRLIVLLDEMGITDKVEVRLVDIPRQDGSGRRDPANPHPEGKVPALLHDGVLITETPAIILTLTNLFPEAGLAPLPGDPRHGAYLTWLFWYGSVMEPVLIMSAAGISHPWMHAALRGVPEVTARIMAALDKGPWLLGDRYSAADLLIQSPYAFFGDITPDEPKFKDWLARCAARPATARTIASDSKLMAARAG